MYDVISIGQATQDVYLVSKRFRIIRDKRFITGQAECFAFGTKVELDDVLFEVGGGATNTAVTFSRQGLRTAVVTRVGLDPAGESVKRLLMSYGIYLPFVITDPEGRTGYSTIFLTSSGERTILVYRGVSHTLQPNDVSWSKARTRWFYISSLAGNIPLLKKALSMARKYRTHVALNPGALELSRGLRVLGPLIKNVDVLLVNRSEAATLLRVPYENDRAIVRGMDRVCDGIAVITEGKKGSWVCDGMTVRKVVINPVKAVDTTGAGDAYGSGFVAGLIKRPGDIDYALRLASINSASVVQQIGAKHGLILRALPQGKKWMHIKVEKY